MTSYRWVELWVELESRGRAVGGVTIVGESCESRSLLGDVHRDEGWETVAWYM